MSEHEQYPAPPPKGRGLFGQSAPAPPPPPRRQQVQQPQYQAASPQPLQFPPNRFGENVKAGFGLGVGIWLAFAVLSAVVWFVLLVLLGLALS